MTEDIKGLIVRRGQIKSQVTRFDKFPAETKNDERLIELRSRLEKIETYWSVFDDVQSRIEMLDESSEQISERESFETKYFDVVARARQRIEGKQKRSDSVVGEQLIQNQSIRLPQISLPEFSGEYDKWLHFHDIFKSLIHDNANIVNAQKFHYLQATLKGEPLQIIQSLEITDSNYVVAWQLLRERHENKKLIVQMRLKGLLELPQVQREGFIALRNLLNEFLKHYRCLKSLGQGVNHWDTILLYILSIKLDTVTKRDWENASNLDANYVLNSGPGQKTLGISWNACSDSFGYSMNLTETNSKQVTKRAILSIIAQLFDPLGLVSPVTTKAKIIMQKLWHHGVSWDETLPEYLHKLWQNYYNEFESMRTIKIPRHVIAEKAIDIQIHGFCDASESAYGACVYIRSSTDIDTLVKLLCAKSRVAPIKTVSLPRLELCGAVLLAQLINRVLDALKINLQPNRIYCWCDSTIALHWKAGQPNRWKTFVANRVSEIQLLTQGMGWRHISSDLISRGSDPGVLRDNKLWWNGPVWLLMQPPCWPESPKEETFEINNDRTVPNIKALKNLNRPADTWNDLTFNNGDDSQPHEIVDLNTIVYASSNQCGRGSSKVKLKNLVDYKWETKPYPGHLIAVHIGGLCVAYVIKVSSRVSGAEGMVRVMSCGKRFLIKGMAGEVHDLQFAHNEKEHILACAESTILHVYKVDVKPESLNCNLLFEIEDPIMSYVSRYDKLVWCPYVIDETFDCEDDANQILVWSRGNCFQCFNMSIILNTYGKGKYAAKGLTEGYLSFYDKSVNITWIALSPDGTTLSVGSEDGYIRFYQIYFHERQPRRLHQWNPHEGQPISSFFFLDNLTKTSADAYWKYALTGANANTEFKIWDCCSWDCLQILSLKSYEYDKLSFIADIDRTASYLIVSSIEINIVYVVQLVNESPYLSNASEKKIIISPNTKPIDLFDSAVNVFMKSICEFPLSSPILSFSIVDATVKQYRHQESESNLTEDLDEYEDDNNALCVAIRMFVVQPKSVQECYIIYQPTVSETTSNQSITSYTESKVRDSLEYGNLTEVISSEASECENMSFNSKTLSKLSPLQHLKMIPTNLLAKRDDIVSDVSKEVMSTLLMLANVSSISNVSKKTLAISNKRYSENQIHEDGDAFKKMSMKTVNKTNGKDRIDCDKLQQSGGSSPSREVQQILSNSSRSTQHSQKLIYNSSGEIHETSNKFDNSLKEDSGNVKQINNNKENSLEDNATICNHNEKLNESQNLQSKLDQLTDIIRIQSSQISEIRTDMQLLKKQNAELVEIVKHTSSNRDSYLPQMAEEIVIRIAKIYQEHVNGLANSRKAETAELKESVLNLINQFFKSQLPLNQSRSVAEEVQRQITADILKQLELIDHHVRNEIGRKFSSADIYLKENIGQLCQNKTIISAFGESIMNGVQSALQAVYMQSMSNILIPAYEKSSKEMFIQLHDTFSLGIKDVVGQFENYFYKIQPISEGIEVISEKILNVTNVLEKFDSKNSASEKMNSEMKTEFHTFRENIIRLITDTIQKEIRKNFETQSASLEDSVLSVVRSQAQTPVPTVYDVQEQIRYLIYQGQVNKAFHQALIANDLLLVEYLLEKADYKNVFNPCMLEQTVLLSLIQQIAADLENHTDLKQRYLADAIINLNHMDPVIKEHAPRVLREFLKNCHTFLLNHPKNQLCSNIRMTMMAVQGMGFKCL